MQRILVIAGLVLGVLIAAALIVPFLIPPEVYKARIEKVASEALSRDVTLAGNPRVSVLPRLAARIDGVTVANAEGFEGTHLIRAGELSASVKWLPLLSRKVEIERFSFIDADVNLQRKPDGTVNWNLDAFKPKEDENGNRTVDAAVGRAELKNARLVYSDAQAGVRYELSELDLVASMKALDEPLKGKGEGKFQGETFTVTLSLDNPLALSEEQPATVKAALNSSLGKADFEGQFSAGEKPALNGSFSAGADNLAALVKFSGTKVDMDLAALGKVTVKGSVAGPVDALKVSIAEAKQASDLIKAGFSGDVTLGEKMHVAGRLDVSAPSVAALATFAKAELPVKVDALGGVTAKASIDGLLPEPVLNFEALTLKGPLMTAEYAGRLVPGKVPQLDGTFKASVLKAGELATSLGVKLEAPQLFENAEVSGRLKGTADRLALTGISATHAGVELNAKYQGDLILAKEIELNGTLTATVPRAGDFARAMKIELPAANAIESVNFGASVKGPMKTLKFSDLTLNHSGALINAGFKGQMQLGGDGALSGNFSANSAALRGLLKATDVEMAPGPSLQSFSAKGGVNGSFKKLAFSGLDLTLDAIKAEGNAGLDFSGARPRLTGALDMGTLDLTPFLSSGDAKSKGALTGWSKEPLDLAGLKSADADLKIRTSTLKIGKTEFTNASVNATLTNGKLVADLPSFKAFQGDWSGQLVLDTSSGTPVLNFNGEGRAVAMSKMLGTLANFSRLDGTGSFRVKANATGTSIDALMRDLDGDMSTNLTEGALKGFNVAQAVRSASSLREAVATGNLRNLDFGAVLSTAAETDFTKFESVLKIENGVAKVDLLKLLNPVLGIDGTGRIDIGGQTLDVRLATAIDKKGTGAGSVVQLNGIPVPVRISGSWSKLRVTPDFSGIEAQLRADAGARVRDEVTSRVGGAGGGVVSDVLDLPKKTAPAPVPSTAPADASSPVVTPSPAPAPAKPATTLKDAGKKAVRDALGGLINTKKPAPAPAPEPEPAPTPAPEPAIEVQPESPPIEGGG